MTVLKEKLAKEKLAFERCAKRKLQSNSTNEKAGIEK